MGCEGGNAKIPWRVARELRPKGGGDRVANVVKTLTSVALGTVAAHAAAQGPCRPGAPDCPSAGRNIATVLAADAAHAAIVGRVCVDEDGDGRCGDAESGAAGIDVFLDDGRRARTDEQGAYHFLAMRPRPVLSTVGGPAGAEQPSAIDGLSRQRIRLDTRGLSRSLSAPVPAVTVEPAPAALVRVDFALLRSATAPPMVAVAGRERPGRSAPRPDGIAFVVTGKTRPDAIVFVQGRRASVDPNGLYGQEVELGPRGGRVAIAVASPGGEVAFFEQRVDGIRRPDRTLLVIPRAPVAVGQAEFPPPDGPVAAGRFVLRATLPANASLTFGPETFEARPEPDDRPRRREVALDPGSHDVDVTFVSAAGVRQAFRWPFEARAEALVVGLFSAELGFSPSDGRVSLLGRGALTYRRMLGSAELAAGLTLDNERFGQFLAPDRRLGAGVLGPGGVIERVPPPSRTALEPGDDALEGDDNPSRGAVFMRLRHPRHGEVRVGALHASLGPAEVGFYRRALFGASATGAVALGPVTLGATAFGAPAAPGADGAIVPVHDEHAATGGSLYYLRHGDVVEGSEHVRLERRDARTGALLSDRELLRHADYAVDYVQGRILLGRPAASLPVDEAFQTLPAGRGEVAVLVVDYAKRAPTGAARPAAGGVLRARLGRSEGAQAEIAARGAVEGEAYGLVGGSARTALGPVRLSADVARSTGAAFAPAEDFGFAHSVDGGLTFAAAPAPAGPGSAAAVRLELGDRDRGLSARWRWREAGFADGRFASSGFDRELGASGRLRLGSARLFAAASNAHVLYRRWPESGEAIDRLEAGGGAGLDLGAWHLTAEGRYLSEIGVEAPGEPAVPGARAGAGLKIACDVTQRLTLHASHHQTVWQGGTGIGARPDTFTAVGGTWRGGVPIEVRVGYGPTANLQAQVSGELEEGDTVRYGAYTFDPAGPDTRLVTGARRKAGEAVATFVEQGIVRDADAVRATMAMGLTFAPAEPLRLVARYERGALAPWGAEAGRVRDVGGARAEFGRGRLRVAASAEVRREAADGPATPVDRWQTVATAAASLEISAGVRLSARGMYARTRSFGLDEATAFEAQAGAGVRRGGFSLIAHYAAAHELLPPSRGFGAAYTEHVVAIRPVWLASRWVQLGAGAYLGVVPSSAKTAITLAATLRPAVVLFDRFELAVEGGRRLGDLADRDGPWALRAEAGVLLGPVRIAFGYNLLGYPDSGVVDRPSGPKTRVYLRAEVAE